MRKRIEFLAMYGICWTLLFQFFRVIFLTYHYRRALEITPRLWAASAFHGLQMDISFASYILLLPTLVIGLTAKSWQWYKRSLLIYSKIIAFLIILLVVTDLELFRAWGFRIDGTSLHYLATPREAFASMGAAPVLPLLLLFAGLFLLVNRLLGTIIRRETARFSNAPFWLTVPAFCLLAVGLIIPIRGGFQLAPMNESAVFFSDKSFANYAAVNVPWNYMSSIINATYSRRNPFIYDDEKTVSATVDSLYEGSHGTEQIIRPDGPKNVIVIIWESFTAKIVSHLGGVKSVTPEFDKLASEGILFTNMYASGNRSDKGMVAILSGYPAQPTHSIIKVPKKTRSLPSLPREFHKNGWYTNFYYGGETEFANMKSYFLQQKFNRIVDKNSFNAADMNSKWGAHDHVVLTRVLHDLDGETHPFFTTVFTLSSHEPFEVPVPTAIPGEDSEHLFLNAHHYTDAAIGDFIRAAKKKSWWKNTLVVIIADHGHPLPETQKGKPAEFHIPMLWLGGVLEKKNMRVDTLCSQTDLAATLLDQFHLSPNAFHWSNDIFKEGRKPFAYFAFNNGFGWLTPDGYLVRDNLGGNITEHSGTTDANDIRRGKAYLQASFSDYIKR